MIRCPLVVLLLSKKKQKTCQLLYVCIMPHSSLHISEGGSGCHVGQTLLSELSLPTRQQISDAPLRRAFRVRVMSRCEAGLSAIPEFQSGPMKTWRRRVSEGSSWQMAACACLRTWDGNTCKRRQEVTSDGWSCLFPAQWKCHVTWACVVGGGLLGFGGLDGPIAFFLHWSSLRTKHIQQPCCELLKLTNFTLNINLWGKLWRHFLHLVCALVSALLVNKGEGLPADFGALARWTLTSLKHSPFWWEPPVKDGLKLCSLNGAQKNHGFCRGKWQRTSQAPGKLYPPPHRLWIHPRLFICWHDSCEICSTNLKYGAQARKEPIDVWGRSTSFTMNLDFFFSEVWCRLFDTGLEGDLHFLSALLV